MWLFLDGNFHIRLGEMASVRRFLDVFVFLVFFQLCSSTDTISPIRCITDGKILVSTGEIFALGFFSPGNSKNRYVGVWFNKVSEKTVVWVANRDNPVPDFTGVLTMAGDGNLVVLHGDRKSPLWSTNISTATSNSTAKLLDSGNLVLCNGQGKRIIWQSFDYPSDTWLPGMRIGLNRKTGLSSTVTSWKSRDDPAPGDYSIRLDPRGSPQFFLYKGLAPYWRSGPWNGREFSGMRGMRETQFLIYDFVSNGDESYLTYIVDNSSILSRVMLEESGSAKRMTWRDGNQGWMLFATAPSDRCDYYGHCGVYGSCNPSQFVECQCMKGFEPKSPQDWYVRDWAGGCVRKRALECGTGEGFLKLAHVKVPDSSLSRLDMNLSLKECEKECLRNCSCTGYSSANITEGESGCVAWYGDLMDVREFPDDGGQDFYLRVDATELAQARRESKGFLGRESMVVILTVSVDVGVLFLVVCGYYSLKKRRAKGKIEKRRHHRERILHNLTTSPKTFRDSTNTNELDDSRTSLELPSFELSILIAATDNFCSSNKLGQGGFGPVYKGRLSNGQEIAVKRLSKNSRQGMEEFRNEIMLIAKLQHRNLVRLMGYCIHAEERMLIYEYMPNKSLDTLIFDQSRRALLDWRKCFEIIVGIARGILYLHQDSRFRVIHRDLKASNILLDAELNPKISDFGMARIFGGEQTQANTSRVVGTYGYMSPEYAMRGLFSIKSDVFSFGVLLMEIISGMKNNNYYPEDPALNLLGHAWNLWREGRVLEIVDSSMGDSCPSDEILRCIQVGLLCVQERAPERPIMSSVIFMLINDTTLPPPNQPAFFMRETPMDTLPASINDLTITAAEAR